MERETKLVTILIVIAVNYVSVYDAQTYASAPPCCRNLIGTQTCSYLYKANTKGFINRCNTEIDFRVIQCCQLCDTYASSTVINSIPQTYDNAVQRMLNATGNCFDRMSTAYCNSFVQHTSPWQSSYWTCASKYAHLAFRICRLSCGYCTITNITAPPVPLNAYTQANAYTSCALK